MATASVNHAVDYNDQDVLAASTLEVIEGLKPEQGAFGLLDPQAGISR